MRRAAGIALLLPFLAVALAAPAAPAAPPHDTAFWHALAAKEFAVPEGESVSVLALEAADLLASPDPKLRDSVAFDALARWVYVQGLVPPDGLEALRLRLQAGLGKGLGETGTDSAYGRSFSALSLSILAAVDLKSPWMTKEAFEDLLAATTRYLTAETRLLQFPSIFGEATPVRLWIAAGCLGAAFLATRIVVPQSTA